MFDCERNNNNYIPVSAVPFGLIRETCALVDDAARIYGCTIDDLVWPSTVSCGCPYCKCPSLNTDGDIQELKSYKTGGPSKTCFNCACVNGTSIKPGLTGLVYSCDEISSVNEAIEWQDFECPPSSCTDANNNTRSANEKWFGDIPDDAECDEFCYCSSQDTVCTKGWDNIISGDTLKPFREQCGDAKAGFFTFAVE